MVANATGCSSIYGGNLPTTPVDDRRGRPRAGLVELAVRGQRRVRPRLPARRRPAHSSWPAAALAELRDAVGAELVGRDPRARRSCASRSCARSAAGSTSCRGGSTALDGPGRGRPAQRRRPSRPAQRLDRRRRRLGLRHRLRRARPRARQRPQRQRARARHRGLLEHRRPDRRRPRRSAPWPSSPPPARPCPRRTSRCRRSPTATSTSRGSRWAPTRSRR